MGDTVDESKLHSSTHFKSVAAILGPALLQTSKLMVLTFVTSITLALVPLTKSVALLMAG